MQWTIRIIGAFAMTGVSTFAISGCEGQQGDQGSAVVIQDSMEEAALKEVGTLYKWHIDEAKRPPKRVNDFAKNGVGMAIGYDYLTRGDLVIFWGAALSDAPSDTVLAYEKKAPKEGGYVLMLDGTTVKKMTAEEFNAAPKAGTASEAGKAKR